MLEVSLYRYNPETDEAPYMQDFSVDTSGRDLMVLDVLELIKADYDGSVTYRRSCREGVCGSDGLNMKRQKWPRLRDAAVRDGQGREIGDSTLAWSAGHP